MKLRAILALASAMLLASVFVMSVEAGPVCSVGDNDSDGICDDDDNCLGINNPVQYDADADGYGNICDYDVDNDCVVGIFDITASIAAFGAPAPHESDVNELNNGVDIFDVTLQIEAFGTGPIGPSGKSCQTCPSPVGAGNGACPG